MPNANVRSTSVITVHVLASGLTTKVHIKNPMHVYMLTHSLAAGHTAQCRTHAHTQALTSQSLYAKSRRGHGDGLRGGR